MWELDVTRRFDVCRDPHPNPGAARSRILFRCIVQFDSAAVFFENFSDDGKSEAGALLARRDIWLKQPVAIFLRQANAIVDDIDVDHVAFADRRNMNVTAA